MDVAAPNDNMVVRKAPLWVIALICVALFFVFFLYRTNETGVRSAVPQYIISNVNIFSTTTTQQQNTSLDSAGHNVTVPSSSSSPPSSPPPKPADKWFWLWSEKTTYLWRGSAYIDTRVGVYGKPVIISLVYREIRPGLINKNFSWYCHVRKASSGDQVCTGKATFDRKVEGIGYQFHSFSTATYFICQLPPDTDHSDIDAVAFSTNSCSWPKISPFVPIKRREKVKEKVLGMCLHKALFEVTNPQLIVQYVELHRLLGVELFTVYVQKVSSEVREILNSYSKEGIMDVVEWGITISPKVIRDFGQIGVIHDCLLRNQDRVTFLGFSDFDEIFVPLRNETLDKLLSRIDTPQYGSFRFLHVFMHDTPSNKKTEDSLLKCPRVHFPLYFKRYKSSDFRDSSAYDGNTLGSKAKVFVKPEGIVRMTRHSMRLRVSHKFAPGFSELTVPGESGLLFHYRAKLQRRLEHRPLVKQSALEKYQNPLMERLNERLCKTNN